MVVGCLKHLKTLVGVPRGYIVCLTSNALATTSLMKAVGDLTSNDANQM